MIINFWGNLKELLWSPFRGLKRVEYELTRQASVKDIVESFGVPHTEVGRLTIDGRATSLSPVPVPIMTEWMCTLSAPLWMY